MPIHSIVAILCAAGLVVGVGSIFSASKGGVVEWVVRGTCYIHTWDLIPPCCWWVFFLHSHPSSCSPHQLHLHCLCHGLCWVLLWFVLNGRGGRAWWSRKETGVQCQCSIEHWSMPWNYKWLPPCWPHYWMVIPLLVFNHTNGKPIPLSIIFLYNPTTTILIYTLNVAHKNKNLTANLWHFPFVSSFSESMYLYETFIPVLLQWFMTINFSTHNDEDNESSLDDRLLQREIETSPEVIDSDQNNVPKAQWHHRYSYHPRSSEELSILIRTLYRTGDNHDTHHKHWKARNTDEMQWGVQAP